MLLSANVEKFICEGISFLTFLLVCGLLVSSRLSKKASLMTAAGWLLVAAATHSLALLLGADSTLILTILPFTLYLPSIILLHIISGDRPFTTAAAWSIGAMASSILSLLRKTLISSNLLRGAWSELLIALCILVAAVGIIAVIFAYVRKPFRKYVNDLDSEHNWLVLSFPVLMIMLLFSYFANSTTDAAAILLLFLTATSVFSIIIRLIASSASLSTLREEQKQVERQMELQRREYEEMRSTLETGREYRHDMRHHLMILEGLARQEDARGVIEYVEALGGRLSSAEEMSYCRNFPVNAVISGLLGRARNAGCKLETVVELPEKLPFDELDVCILIANALENALNACMDIAEGHRFIKTVVQMNDMDKLTVQIENPCLKQVIFGADGLPVSRREGHGIGLRSVRAITQKYNGIFQCKAENGEFCFQAVLFSNKLDTSDGMAADNVAQTLSKKLGWKRGALIAILIFVVAALLVLYVLAMDGGMAIASLVGKPVGGITIRTGTISSGWGDSRFEAEIPLVETETDGDGTQTIQEFQEDVEKYIEQLRDEFDWYMSRRYQGYVGMDTEYEVLCNDENILSVRFYTTLNAGGSGEFSKCFTLDKTDGNILELSELFLPDSNYVEVISEEIAKQMREQMESGNGDYFLPGGIWPPEECFYEIEPDQDYYFDGKGRLTITFREYQVAPGSMGSPEFAIPTQVLKAILNPDLPLWNDDYKE